MENLVINSEEIHWILRNSDFRNNSPFLNKLKNSIPSEELILGEKAWVITLGQDENVVKEVYDLPTNLKSECFGFITEEQYFTDPEAKKIHFSERGFGVFTDGDYIYLINRENSTIDQTHFKYFESGKNKISLKTNTKIIKLDHEIYWFSSKDDYEFDKRIEESRRNLQPKNDYKICPSCFQEILKSIMVKEMNYLGCELCESLFL